MYQNIINTTFKTTLVGSPSDRTECALRLLIRDQSVLDHLSFQRRLSFGLDCRFD